MTVPYIPAKQELKEFTVRGVILGVLLAIILGAANAYLGLKVGLTVSASVPAAVISMAILRWFKNSNILENNMVQTAASAGESLAAGVLFTIPALLILGYWDTVHYWETTAIALAGGILGVLFTVPLRRAFIVEAQLTFPEGIATSEVLKSGEKGEKGGVIALLTGVLIGIGYKFFQSGMHMWQEGVMWGSRMGERGAIAFGSGLSPALLAVGYIIRLRIAVLVFMGGVIGWIIAIPAYSLWAKDTVVLVPGKKGEPPVPKDWVAEVFDVGGSAVDVSDLLWSSQIRYLGVGAMLVGGLWSLIQLRRPLGQALAKSLNLSKSDENAIRTERELSTRATFIGVLGMVIPIMGLYWYATWDLGWWQGLLVALLMGAIMVVTGFFFSAVGGYMAGLVGSSNNPISGVTILTVLAAAFSLLGLSKLGIFDFPPGLGPGVTILVAAIIACAGAIASDNMQDLKCGYILGATPRRQQYMQIIGVTGAAVAIAPVLNILHKAYDLGSPEMPAVQASLMAAVAQFVFGGGLPAFMISMGAGIAVLLILLDSTLKSRGAAFRTPVMPVAVGIYLPAELSVPIFLGGLLAWFIARSYGDNPQKVVGDRNGVLAASGLIAGEALVGILLAILLVSIGKDGALPFAFDGAPEWGGYLMFGFVILVMWFLAMRPALVKHE